MSTRLIYPTDSSRQTLLRWRDEPRSPGDPRPPHDRQRATSVPNATAGRAFSRVTAIDGSTTVHPATPTCSTNQVYRGGMIHEIPSKCRGPAGDRSRRVRSLFERRCIERTVSRCAIRGRAIRGRPIGRAVRRAGRDRLVPHPEQRSWQEPVEDTRRRVHSGPSQRQDRHPVLENEAFKTKLTTLLQQGNVPDLFQSWGGGGLRQQVEAGLRQGHHRRRRVLEGHDQRRRPGHVRRSTASNYGIPFDLGLVGFWYNTKSFTDAGITTLPATWDEFLTTVQTLKGKGITPIALAGKDTWTGAFYWAYLAVRNCGQAGMDKAVTTGDWSDPCFVKAGEQFKQLIDLKPFQEGFLAAPWDGAGSGAAAHGDLQRRHPAHGPVAPGHRQRQLRRQAGDGRRPRLVPVPGGRPAAPATRSTASAAATASRSARTHRPRRSTSCTTSSAWTRRTGGAP